MCGKLGHVKDDYWHVKGFLAWMKKGESSGNGKGKGEQSGPREEAEL